MKNVKLTKMFARISGSKESFSLAPPLQEEIQYASGCLPRDCNSHTTSSVTIVRWISESMCPFRIVKDRGLRWLCKTGQPHFYLPNDTTVAKDVKFLHDWLEHHLAEELQVNPLNPHLDLTTLNLQQAYPGNLAYQLNCWTLLNHRAFINILVTWVRHDCIAQLH